MAKTANVDRLLTQAEKKRFAPILENQMKSLTEGQLQKTYRAARDLRDKYRDLAKRQRSTAKKRQGTVDAAKRTDEKAKIFAGLSEKVQLNMEKRKSQTRRGKDSVRAKAGSMSKALSKKVESRVHPVRAALKKSQRQESGMTSVPVEDGESNLVRRQTRRLASTKATESVRKAKQVGRTPLRRIAAHQGSAAKRNQARRDAR